MTAAGTVLFAFTLAVPPSAPAPAEPTPNPSDRSPSTAVRPWVADVTFGYFVGDYGTDGESEIEVFSPRLRRSFSRGEIRASFPYVRMTTAGAVTWVGGNPVAAGTAAGLTLPSGAGRRTESVEGQGDLRLQGELDFLQGGPRRPWLSGGVKLKLPTADRESGLGTGELDVEGAVSLVQELGRTSLLADAGYLFVGDPADAEMNDVTRLGAGLSCRIGERRGSYLYAYLENRTHPTPGGADRLDVSLGGSRRLGAAERVRVSAAAYFGLSRAAEDFGLSLALGRTF